MTLHSLPDISDPRRLVALDGVHNFRDMGGYPTADGRTTRWGRLYRADGLFRLTSADVESLRPLGLRTVVDLRTQEEIDLRGRFPVDAHPVQFHHVPVLDTTWDHPADEIVDAAAFLSGKYVEMLVEAPQRFTTALEILGAAEALPAVFHCAAGKDRTGVTAMLILGALGVPRDYLAADYQLTADGMRRMQAWAQREMPEMFVRMSNTPSAIREAVAEAMYLLVDWVESQYGTIRNLVLEIGVQPSTLARFEAELLE